MAMTIKEMLLPKTSSWRVISRKPPQCECGAPVLSGSRFCQRCGVTTYAIQPAVIASERSNLIRRILAEIADRLTPLPFIAYFFPPWLFVVLAYHLVCDGAPSGRSPGKWLARLRVVAVSTSEPCGVWRSILRRLPIALGQIAYCSWVFVPIALAYDLLSLAFVWLNPTSRRIEDYIAGTQVITEHQYQTLRPLCEGCGLRVGVSAAFCPNCGKRRN